MMYVGIYEREIDELTSIDKPITVSYNRVTDNILFVNTEYQDSFRKITTIGRITDNIDESDSLDEPPLRIIDIIINEEEYTPNCEIIRELRISCNIPFYSDTTYATIVKCLHNDNVVLEKLDSHINIKQIKILTNKNSPSRKSEHENILAS